MEIEDVFCSRLRMKILKALARVGELNASEIARRLGVNFETTSRHLRILEGEGILEHKEYGRIRLYRINERSPKAKAVQNLLNVWEQAETKKT
jgi:DNA-binding transcriptional ArsR family regulator